MGKGLDATYGEKRLASQLRIEDILGWEFYDGGLGRCHRAGSVFPRAEKKYLPLLDGKVFVLYI